jgi:hypothetical protein
MDLTAGCFQFIFVLAIDTPKAASSYAYHAERKGMPSVRLLLPIAHPAALFLRIARQGTLTSTSPDMLARFISARAVPDADARAEF